jgi:2-polyprenyl-3-methyl-5-hydroxy-6-metoxy-1,4-benzoquinol methylase
MADPRNHWNTVYATRASTAVSWHQPHAEQSLKLIRTAAVDRSTPIIDVGGGASTLVDDLLAEGYSDLTVLDISEAALSQAKARLASNAAKVAWIVGDVTTWKPQRSWAIWHDRAVFHFLIEKAQQDAYVAALTMATTPGATVIIATFALDGPEKCSGLPVQRYSPQLLAARLGADFRLVSEAAEHHHTPGGAEQSFVYSVLQRRKAT